MSRSRRSLSALLIVGFACAQFMGLARACALDADIGHGMAATSLESAGMPADCPMIASGAAVHHTCEAQCFPRAQAGHSADPRIAVGPPSVIVVRLVTPAVSDVTRAAPPLARIASPPLSVLFSRFRN